MTKLSEAYLHLKPFDISEAETKDLTQYLKVYGKELGREIYKSEIEIQVEIEAGSLKIWIFYGCGILYTLIVTYGSFRSGIDYLANDGKKVAQLINKHIIEKLKPDPQQIYHKERRRAVPGQLQRIISDLDYLSQNINQLPPNIIEQKIKRINKRLRKVLRSIDDADEQKYIIQNIEDDASFHNLPSDLAHRIMPSSDELQCMRCAPKKIVEVQETEIPHETDKLIHIKKLPH